MVYDNGNWIPLVLKAEIAADFLVTSCVNFGKGQTH
jgi:hypothetical protein